MAPACVREELASLAFDGALRVPALLLAAPAALALYGAGKTTVRARGVVARAEARRAAHFFILAPRAPSS